MGRRGKPKELACWRLPRTLCRLRCMHRAWHLALGMVFLAAAACGPAPAPASAPEPAPRADTSRKPAEPPKPQGKPLPEGELVAIPGHCGLELLVNWNGTTIHASLTSQETKALDTTDSKSWLLDGHYFEVSFLPAKAVFGERLEGQALLDRAREWEIETTAKTNHWKPPRYDIQARAATASSLPTLSWSLTPPGPLSVRGKPISSISYASVGLTGAVLVVSAAIIPGMTPDIFARVQDSLARTLTVEPGVPTSETVKTILATEGDAACQ